MLVKKLPFSSRDLNLFLNEQMSKIIQNIEARNGALKSFDLNFHFEKCNYCVTEKDIRSFRSRIEE
ncbi:MAG: hypothetical protein AWM53_00811 [Candidatus Dichloromethanomonas elyunquensis]|nr:MAG: hypothetical protein AWM53_00811 [Candidatus Dichloromethanomonas elyunquensis]